MTRCRAGRNTRNERNRLARHFLQRSRPGGTVRRPRRRRRQSLGNDRHRAHWHRSSRHRPARMRRIIGGISIAIRRRISRRRERDRRGRRPPGARTIGIIGGVRIAIALRVDRHGGGHNYGPCRRRHHRWTRRLARRIWIKGGIRITAPRRPVCGELRPGTGVNRKGSGHCCRRGQRRSDRGNIVHRLGRKRRAAGQIPVQPIRAGVVRSQEPRRTEPVIHLPQVGGACQYVVVRIERIVAQGVTASQVVIGVRHHLHQAHRAGPGDHVLLPARFLPHHAADPELGHAEAPRSLPDVRSPGILARTRRRIIAGRIVTWCARGASNGCRRRPTPSTGPGRQPSVAIGPRRTTDKRTTHRRTGRARYGNS